MGWLTDTSGGGRVATGGSPPPQPESPDPIALTTTRNAATGTLVVRMAFAEPHDLSARTIAAAV